MATSPMEKVTNNSDSNYCKMPDGTLIQWGAKNVPANAWTATVTLPMEFVDASYSAVAQPKDTGTDWTVGGRTKGSFQIGRSPLTNSNDYHWIAIGRWK